MIKKNESLNQSEKKYRHDKRAPFWAATLVLLGVAGISTIRFKLGGFWNGYVLDMTGPAWNYILFRGLYTGYAENAWIKFFTPLKTLIIFLCVCFGIEMMQYFHIYDATFGPWDLVAYVSILIPVFIVDYLNWRKWNK